MNNKEIVVSVFRDNKNIRIGSVWFQVRVRNHGFLDEWERGWRLSPACDLNPTPIEIKPRILATTIDFGGSSCSFETALLVAEEFRLKKREAHSIMKEVAAAVKEWQAVALDFGISKKECDRMSSAFKYEKNI